jgi:hypothetical protein
MSITDKIKDLSLDPSALAEMKKLQDYEKFQELYAEMLKQGLIKKRGYGLAQPNTIGVPVPGQSTFKVSLDNL